MAQVPMLIYCADGNARFAQIAIDAGFRYGAQLPNTVYHPVYFADQNWRNPNREAYMAALAKHRPEMATVLDWEQESQLDEVLDWAEEAALSVQKILIVPKVVGGIGHLPRSIGGKPVVLAYSVPTKFSGTNVPLWEFRGWPVHLLGGQPHRQIEIWRYLHNVVSTDGNYAQMMAVRYNEFWSSGGWHELCNHDGHIENDAPYKAFEHSCKNIMAAWGYLVDTRPPGAGPLGAGAGRR